MTARTSYAVLAAAVTCLLSGAPAHAHDSLAPPSANHAWLPAHDDWVMQHWVPFDETRLLRALDIDNDALERWLRDDHRTIAGLAKGRTGIGADDLADHLIEPWRASAGPERLIVLRERTMRMVTQGHLAQHVLYHYFHGTYALDRTRPIFGVERKVYQRMRVGGMTPFQIGRRGGRTPAHVARGMRWILEYGARIGLENGSHTPQQSAYMLRRRMALLPCFLRRPMPKFDPGNPYGDPDNGHGSHRRRDLGGLLRGSKQSRARRHPRSCWQEPRMPAAAEANGRAAICHVTGRTQGRQD